jgi:ribonuclease BN (tRNA processing enzyme)
MASTTRLKQVRVYGEATKLAAIKTHLFSELIFPILPPIEWIELESLGPSFSLGETRVTWFPLEHPGGSVGYRLDLDGRSLAYVTDTCAQSDAAYVSLIQQVDLLVHECNFADRDHSFAKKTGHSWVSQVLHVARLAQVKHLLLTHFNPFDQRQDPVELEAVLASLPETLPFEVTIASDESVIDF